jgi:dUTPase
MSNTILMIKLIQKENDILFNKRKKMYKNAVEKHNLMVWSTKINKDKVYGLYEYPDIYFNNGETDITFEKTIETRKYTRYDPNFDSGFDIFQPIGKEKETTEGETKSYDLDPGTHIIGLGLKGAMYTFKENNARLIDNKCCLFKRIFLYDNISEMPINVDINTFNIVKKIQNNLIIGRDNRYHIKPTPYKLHPRSSIYKKAVRQANCTGIIDSGYRGEISAAVDCLGQRFGKGNLRTTLEEGNRYFQICRANLKPFYIVLLKDDDELPETNRGSGGFGSTGR